MLVDLDPSRDGPGIVVNIVRSEATYPLRELRVLMPGGACEDDPSRFCDGQARCEGEIAAGGREMVAGSGRARCFLCEVESDAAVKERSLVHRIGTQDSTVWRTRVADLAPAATR